MFSSVLRVLIWMLIVVSLPGFCNSQIVQCQKMSLKGEGFIAVLPPQQILSVAIKIENFFGLSLQQPIAGRLNRVSGFANEVATAPTVGYEHRWGMYKKDFNFTYKGIQPPIISQFNGTKFLRAPMVQLLNYVATDNALEICVEFCAANPEPIEITWYKQIGIYNTTDDAKKLKRDRRWLKTSFDFVCDVSKKVLPVIAEVLAPECSTCPTLECPLCEQVPCVCEVDAFSQKWVLIGGAVLDSVFLIVNLVFFYCSGKKSERAVKKGLLKWNKYDELARTHTLVESSGKIADKEMVVYNSTVIPVPPPLPMESFTSVRVSEGPAKAQKPCWMDEE